MHYPNNIVRFLQDYLLVFNAGGLVLTFILLISWSKLLNLSILLDVLRRTFFLCCLFLFYNRNATGWQFNVSFGNDIPFLPFSYLNFGLNYWGFWLSVLLTILNLINIVSFDPSNKKISGSAHIYFALLILIELGSFGVLCSKEPLWFFIFFEFSILPIFLLINFYGYENRKTAAYRYLIYTAVSGITILMVIAFGISYLPVKRIVSGKELSGIEHFVKNVKNLSIDSKRLYYLLIFISFGIKVPLIGFHFWLPYAHTEAPTAGSVLLAGIILKLGLYGYHIFNGVDFARFLSYLPVTFAVLNLVYGSLIVFYEKDLKKFIAYSSISHMGVAWTAINLLGHSNIALFYAISHGLGTGGLFILAGYLLENNHHRDIKSYTGLIRFSPIYCLLFGIFSLITMGFPGFSGFIGEIYTISATFSKADMTYTIAMAVFILFNTWLTINLISKIIFAKPHFEYLNFHNIHRLYWLIPLIGWSILLGLKPSIIMI